MFVLFLKKNFLWIILALLIVYVVTEQPTLISDLQYKYFPSKACSEPIEYTIGTFDTRFGISEEDFKEVINSSATIWGKGIGKTLFRYNSENTSRSLTINLIYDERQRSTQQNALLQANVDKVSALAASVRAQYTTLQSQYRISEQTYKDQLSAIKDIQRKYNAEVSYWNSRGGAPRSEDLS